MTIEKIIRLMDWLIQGLMIGIIFCWTVWPEDIVGTQELAVLLMFMLCHDVRQEK